MEYEALLLALWELINGNLATTLIGTFGGVYLAYALNSWLQKKNKEHTFAVMADQLAFEWIANSQYAKEISDCVKNGNTTVRRFNLKIAESVLEQSYIFEFAPRVFINKLRVYRENILIINRLMDEYFARETTEIEIENLKSYIHNISVMIDELGKSPIR